MPLYALDGVAPSFPAPERYWIAPDAQVIGKVTLHEDASLWFGVVARGDNEEILVGAGSNVQDGTVLHADPGFAITIGVGCTIGHRAILHGCTIADDCLIGMGATLLNGATLGRHCLVGAQALVTAGQSFPAGSLIFGSPARRVRGLDDTEIAGIEKTAAHYVANWRRFARSLTPLECRGP